MKWLWSWMMNKTQAIYEALLKDLENQKNTLGDQISRADKCSNGLILIYSITISKKKREFSIPIDKVYSKTIFPEWKGAKISNIRIPEYGNSNQVYLSFEQVDSHQSDIFEIIVEDLRKKLEALSDIHKTLSIVLQIIKKWNDFFKRGVEPVLSNLAAQGLYGELLFLKELVDKLGPKSVFYWESENNTHDFYIRTNAVEVKTASTQTPYKAHINSAHQLDNNGIEGKLYLRFYALRTSKNGGQTLPEIIKNIRCILSSNVIEYEHFNVKLGNIGYFDEAEDYYITHYTKVDAYSFEIKDGFPRIRVQDIPSEIFNVQYELAVGQCLNFAITLDELMKGVTK